MPGFCPYSEFKTAIENYRANVQKAKNKWLISVNTIINTDYDPLRFGPLVKVFRLEEANATLESEIEYSRKEFADNVSQIIEKWSTTPVECP